jgi:thiosulfate/3-mercaptopyruvate sulfurtransferase
VLDRWRRWAVVLGIIGIIVAPARGPAAASGATPVAAPSSGATGYTHPEMLVEAGWLRDHLDDPALRVIALTPADEFATVHIPGAGQIDWPALEVTDTSNTSIARWHERVARQLADLAFTPEQTVVVYDNGTLWATRLWWVLYEVGHRHVRVLNGGFSAWQTAGGETATGPPDHVVETPAPAPYPVAPMPDALAQLTEVRARLGDSAAAIVDARTPEEYTAGHIPGALNLNYPLNAVPDVPKRWKPAAELREMYSALGISPDQLVIPYCTTGVRSAVTFFTLRLIGYEHVALYTGSWKEWGANPETPKTTGAAP